MLREINDFKKEISKGIFIDDKGNVYKEIKYSKSNRTYRFEMKGKCIFITKEVKEAFNKIRDEELFPISNYDFIFVTRDKRVLRREDKHVNSLGYGTLSSNYKSYYIHRLVYEAFIGEIPKGYEVHHRDENKLNNSIKNLYLLTTEEHRKTHKHTFKYKEVIVEKDGVQYKIDNPMDFVRENNLDFKCFYRILNGTRKSYKGYKLISSKTLY